MQFLLPYTNYFPRESLYHFIFRLRTAALNSHSEIVPVTQCAHTSRPAATASMASMAYTAPTEFYF